MTNRIIVGHLMGTLPRVGQGSYANANLTVIESDGRTHLVPSCWTTRPS